ncbi:hypothetical protein AALK46_07505 [Staphylococcus nepalensis]|uniref:hypothetical protein n=1 Tax=Staphylococcus nepalensis TaxID=214473 RepID=UPI0035110B40
MAYEYEELILHDVKPLTNPGPPFRYEAMKELQEVYRKARAYDFLKEDIEINEHVFKRQADNDEISNIIHGHYVALLEQSKLEDKQK